MSGKSYTMREMKAIVEYLTEQRAYGEIRGRKMWMDYANSKLTTRTWQSLKETFLKRILPDITNPYYKLTVEQIASFRQGTDIENKINNKLEIQTVHDDSSDDTQKKDPQPSNPNNAEGGNDTGEDIQCSKINQIRSSTETVVIGPCYNTAEEIQKDLESPTHHETKNPSPIPCSTKSIRDYITYSEPLTPMLQEVLHDFASEDEGDEPQMQIVEFPEPPKRKEASSPIEILDSDNYDGRTVNKEHADNSTTKDKSNDEDSAGNNISKNVLQESSSTDCMDKSDDIQSNAYFAASKENTENTPGKDDIVNDVTDIVKNGNSKNIEEKTIQLTKSQNNSNSITDTLLPNNQEAFKELCRASENSLNNQNSNTLSLHVIKNDSRKRSKSEDIECMTPKKRICTDKSIEKHSSDGDTTAQHKETTSKLDFIQNVSQIANNSKHEKKNNHKENSVEPDNTHEEISDKPENFQDSSKNNEIICVSHDTLSKEQQAHQDVSMKRDEDEVSITSEEIESPRNHKGDTNTSNKKPTKQNETPNYIKEVTNEVVILKSHSESASDHAVVTPKKNKASLRSIHKVNRDRALANVFGFSSGAKSSHNKHRKNAKRLSSRPRSKNSSSSNEWTSDTAAEFISPPRGRKNKQSRRYLKPKSARILSLEEEGGLFVMYGKKIYPVVKDGKLIKNYLTYTPDNDSEDEESYWKLKYVEEKKKTDELTRLLKHKEMEIVPIETKEASVPRPNVSENALPTATEVPRECNEKKFEQDVKVPEKREETTEPKTVKIQFMKNNETVQLEGHWSHIHPVLEQVVQILHKEQEPRVNPIPEKISVERKISTKVQQSQKPMPVKKQKVSRDSTPVSTIQLDEDVQEKIDKLEEEIFKEIEEREIAEISHNSTNVNVTKRNVGRPRHTSTANKNTNASEPSKKKSLRSTEEEINDLSIATRRKTRTPKKTIDKETTDSIAKDGKRTTRKSSRNAALEEDDDNIKYMFPSPQRLRRITDKNKSAKATTQTTKRRYPIKTARIFSSPDDISINSIESSQGYQDTDGSNLSICLRKKRRLSITILNRGRGKTHRAPKRKPQPYTHEDMSSDSNISFVTAPLKSSSHQSSSLNTEIYRSESYQMLFPQRQNSIQYLDKIEERSPAIDNLNCSNNNHDPVVDVLAEKSILLGVENNSLSPAFINYEENSSSVTLPPSPVLSIVEKISVSKNTLDNTKDIDMPDNSNHEDVKQTTLNDYMLLDVDMSVPLMEQERGLQKNCHDATECHFSLNMPDGSQQMSDSLLSKVCAVNIAEPTLSESIHQKLKNLLLESAKKIAKQINENVDKDKASTMEICEPENQRKAKAKKRCSTPRKRQNKQNLGVSNVETHIEEEHIESYRNGKSRPPPVLVITDAAEEKNNIVAEDVGDDRRRSDRLRKKKDVIKVKILKPKMKKKEYSSDDTIQKEAKTSLPTDSGINDTESGIFLRGFEDSVDLIHNHSDTCLQARECNGDSVEIIDDNAMSIISLNSNSAPKKKLKSASLTASNDKLLDICCENAQDATNFYTATEVPNHTSNENNCIFKSPPVNTSANSLLTDDLSDEFPQNVRQSRVSKWYLLSEDEASNTYNVDIVASMSNNDLGYGANLQEIFPVTCAVPDLSTITEENTAKFVDGNTKNEFDSQSLYNV